MGNCLVTKLKGVVDNPNLEKLGMLDLLVPVNYAACFIGGTTILTLIDDDCYIEDGNGGDISKTIVLTNNTKQFTVKSKSDRTGEAHMTIDTTVDNFRLTMLQGIKGIDIDRCMLYTKDLHYVHQCYDNYWNTFKFTSSDEKCKNLSYLGLQSKNPENSVKVDLSHFANNERLQSLNLAEIPLFNADNKVTGSIMNLKSMDITSINVIRCPEVSGNLEEFCAMQVSLGRTSGKLGFACQGSSVDIGSLEAGVHTHHIQFGTDMESPSAEDTRKGYKLVD